jgi:Ca2+-binding EF-hand superfamily protein
MSSISSINGSTASPYVSALDKNGDGIVDAQELAAAARSGLLSASLATDESTDDGSGSAMSLSDNLASLLPQMQNGALTGDQSSPSSSSPGTDASDALFSLLDANGDGQVSSAEFVANRPKDLSEADATNLFRSLDTSGSGSINKEQFAEGLDVLKSSNDAAADLLAEASTLASSNSTAASSDSAKSAEQKAFAAYLTQIQQSITLYRNTYGQYELDSSDAGVSA